MVEINFDYVKGLEPIEKISDSKEPKFKKGDRVCYKSHPNIYIGSISSFNGWYGSLGAHYNVFTSGDWFEHFAPFGGPNTLSVSEDEIALYENEDK